MHTKDRRYKTCRNLIQGGYINAFRDIFEIIPKSTIARDLGMNNRRFTRMMDHVKQFSLNDICLMASLLEIEDRVMLEIVMKQSDADLERK